MAEAQVQITVRISIEAEQLLRTLSARPEYGSRGNVVDEAIRVLFIKRERKEARRG